jgi:uncharacterized protein (DUF302 family)
LRHVLAAAALAGALTGPVAAQTVADMADRPGWSVIRTDAPFADLVEATKAAVVAHGMAVVTEAGPTEAAARRGVTIPGNRVIGAFNNVFAVRLLEQSTAAMIEAPLRLYVTENADGSATLSYRLPSEVLAPYAAEAPGVAGIAAELDAVFAAIAASAVSD